MPSINESGLEREDEATYRKVVDELRDDVTDVVLVQDLVSTPSCARSTSEDKTTWVLPVSLEEELGTPRPSTPSTGWLTSSSTPSRRAEPTGPSTSTGPAATVADLTVAGQQDRLPIEIAIAVLVLLVLLLVYRSAVTMLLPLVTIGSSW